MRCFAIGSLLASSALAATPSGYLNYSTVTGYFLQDDPSTNASTFDYTESNFGLINRTYEGQDGSSSLTQWQKFAKEVKRLNKAAPKGTSYKVLWMGRHGEGYHNAAESYYGTPAWNCYWSLLNGNGTSYWEDAHVTEDGIEQAEKANAFWKHQIEVEKIHTPDVYYTSPMARCLETAKLTFEGLSLPKKKPFVPTVKEYLREGVSLHTCDHRSNKTWIQNTYPSFKIEDGFTEYDEIFNGVTAESSDAQKVRSRALLDEILADEGCEEETYISITSHSGEIRSLLAVLGHREFSLSTGQVITVLVKVERIPGSTTTATATYTTSAHCTVPPLTSLSGTGCVCPNSAAPVTGGLVTATPIVDPFATWTPSLAPERTCAPHSASCRR